MFEKIFFIMVLLPEIILAQSIKINNANPSVNYTRLKRIDDMINGYIKNDWIKGAITIIVKDGDIVQCKGYGYADAAMKTPMKNDELFRIASQTKAIACTGVMIPYEQGKLLLDEPVSDFIPDYKDMTVLDKFNKEDTTYTTVPAERAITIRDLLTHTSGIDYPGIGSDEMKAIYAKGGIPAGFNTEKDGQSLLDVMKALAKFPLAHQPGEKWNYGLNYDLLGCLIEVISKTSLDDFFRKNIFKPLGMNDTYFNVPVSRASRLATVYTEDSLHNVVPWEKDHFEIDPDYPLVQKTYFSGGADLTSTVHDYAVFLQMLLNHVTYNGHEILSSRTVDMMMSNQLDFLFNGTNGFGPRFEVVSKKGAAKAPGTEELLPGEAFSD